MESKRKQMSGVLFKVDFEKAYDNVNWAFLYNVLLKKGFSHKWNDLVFSIMTSGKVNIKINDKTGAYFSTNRGVRQGDPLSPILFNVVVDSLSVMIKNAQQEKLIVGMTPHL
jgi:retron-type reverse transcriptase